MVKDVGVGQLCVGIAVLTRGATSMISVAKESSSVPTVSRHFFIPSVVLDLAVIPNAWAGVFGANERWRKLSFRQYRRGTPEKQISIN